MQVTGQVGESTSLNRRRGHLWRISLTGLHEVTRLSEIGCPGEGLRLHFPRGWRRGFVRSSYCVLLSSTEHYRGVHGIGPKVMGLLPGLARTHAVCPSYWDHLISLPRSWVVASSRELRCSVRAGRPKALQSGDSLEKGDEAAVCSFLCDLQHAEARFVIRAL